MMFNGDSFGDGFTAGLVTALVTATIVAFVIMWTSDIYSLGHWKLNMTSPPSMWMNMGYWKTPEGAPITKFPEACSALLEQIVRAAGLLDDEDSDSGSQGSLAILDLGFGCGDQALQLAKLAEARGWSDFRYVGLTLNHAQVQTAWGRIHYEIDVAGSGQESDTDDSGFDTGFVVGVDSFALFCADAAKPETWRDEVAEAVYSLADEKYTERWLLALDCLYYFSPSRKPIVKYVAQELDANFTAFDLLLNEKAPISKIWKARLIGKIMGCPLKTFLSEAEYRDQLVECGYDCNRITVREITKDVFPGLVNFLYKRNRLLAGYGISMAGFELAWRLFDWFNRTRVVRAVIIVARTKSKAG